MFSCTVYLIYSQILLLKIGVKIPGPGQNIGRGRGAEFGRGRGPGRPLVETLRTLCTSIQAPYPKPSLVSGERGRNNKFSTGKP